MSPFIICQLLRQSLVQHLRDIQVTLVEVVEV